MLAFVFFYHGLAPKILWLSQIEVNLTTAHHLDARIFSPLAGVGEIFLGLCVAMMRKTLIPVYVAMALLVALLVDVVIVMPDLLIEAFNPVTTNLTSIALAYIIIATQAYRSPEINSD